MVRARWDLEEDIARTLLDAPKHLGFRRIVLGPNRLGVIQHRELFAVDEIPLELIWESHPHGNRQIILRAPRTRGNLVRLCQCPEHGEAAHWHCLEDLPYGPPPGSALGLPPSLGLGTLWEETFAPALKIAGWSLEVPIEEGKGVWDE